MTEDLSEPLVAQHFTTLQPLHEAPVGSSHSLRPQNSTVPSQVTECTRPAELAAHSVTNCVMKEEPAGPVCFTQGCGVSSGRVSNPDPRRGVKVSCGQGSLRCGKHRGMK